MRKLGEEDMEQINIQNTPSIAPLTRLNRRQMILARILWLTITLIALGLFTAGLSPKYDNAKDLYQSDIQGILTQNLKGEVVITPYGTGAAMYAGILEGDVLVSVNGTRVSSVEQAKKLLSGEPGTQVKVEVRTGNFPTRLITLTRAGQLGQLFSRFGITSRVAVGYVMANEILFAIICVGIGLLIFLRRSDDWMALLASITFITLLIGLSAPVSAFNEQMRGTRYLTLFDIWFSFGVGLLPIFFYLFPTGRFVPRLTLYLTGIIILWATLAIFFPMLYPWHMSRTNATIALLPILGTGAFALFYRYLYHSDANQRTQIRWIVWGALAAAMGLVLQIVIGIETLSSEGYIPSMFQDFVIYPIGQLLKLLLPISVVFAIQRYRLWDINILINRTLVYGALTTLVIVIYIVVVGALGTTIQERGNLLLSILATGLVAVLVQPLRDHLQRGVNRMMYGERDDPITVLSRLGQHLEGTLAPDAVLPSLVETIAQTLKLPYVAIERTDPRLDSQPTIESSSMGLSSPRVAYGDPQQDLLRLPLVYQSETIGELVVAPRAPGEPLSPMDRHLLDNIAHQAGMAIHAVNLTADLQRSRQRLVTTREEERRRLRRDLHDGLGPNLASQGLKLAAVRQLLENNPTAAIPLLDQVMEQNKSTVDDVRRLVYGLRPPALDELGLVAAIRDHVAAMDGKSTLQIELTEPTQGLPPLSAAVEVAAYRIILEALTNVLRHAQADHCAIRFSVSHNGSSDVLGIEIQDNGQGMPENHRAGVGLRSMRERAEEIGGTCEVEPNGRQGTCVSVRVPLITMS
jgi:signal transduction histidine kinase